LKKHHWLISLIVLVALAGVAVWARHRIHFDFGLFRAQLAMANWSRIAIGILCIYAAYVFRSARWALLLRHNQRVPLLSLTGTQVMGFTAVALIGRVADPVRPYLVSRKTGLPLSTQIAVYIVERLFDFGSMAILISLALLWLPSAQTVVAGGHAGIVAHALAPLMQRSPVLGAIITRFGALLLTFVAVLILALLRLSGNAVARFFEGPLIPRKAGHAIAHKIRTFHAGLGAVRNLADFGIAASLSLAMWSLITLSYLETARAFTASPALASLSVPKSIVLLAISGAVSVVQLPVLGWFSQIAIVAAALGSFFGATPEAATACAATLLLVTFLSIIPVGLAWAQFEDVSLRKITAESGQAEEQAEEQLEAQDGVDANAAS
jgi:glycosyltransferase 2 family protein